MATLASSISVDGKIVGVILVHHNASILLDAHPAFREGIAMHLASGIWYPSKTSYAEFNVDADAPATDIVRKLGRLYEKLFNATVVIWEEP